MKVSFQLTMPNVGSWNGKWTGADRKYYVIRNIHKTRQRAMAAKIGSLLGEKSAVSFHYSWNDGWGANVKMEIVDGPEGSKRMRQSSGFCGYEWMIDSILEFGEILNEPEMKRRRENKISVPT
jgi:hypothetical protein